MMRGFEFDNENYNDDDFMIQELH